MSQRHKTAVDPYTGKVTAEFKKAIGNLTLFYNSFYKMSKEIAREKTRKAILNTTKMFKAIKDAGKAIGTFSQAMGGMPMTQQVMGMPMSVMGMSFDAMFAGLISPLSGAISTAIAPVFSELTVGITEALAPIMEGLAQSFELTSGVGTSIGALGGGIIGGIYGGPMGAQVGTMLGGLIGNIPESLWLAADSMEKMSHLFEDFTITWQEGAFQDIAAAIVATMDLGPSEEALEELAATNEAIREAYEQEEKVITQWGMEDLITPYLTQQGMGELFDFTRFDMEQLASQIWSQTVKTPFGETSIDTSAMYLTALEEEYGIRGLLTLFEAMSEADAERQAEMIEALRIIAQELVDNRMQNALLANEEG